MALLVALILTAIASLSTASLFFSWILRRDVRKLLAAFEKTHGYSDPTGAAVVTDSAPAPEATPVPARVPVQTLRTGVAPFPPVERRVVTHTRDDDIAHIRETVEVPAPTSSDQERSDQDAMRLPYDAWEEAEAEREAERAASTAKWEAAEEKRQWALEKRTRTGDDTTEDQRRTVELPRLARVPDAAPLADDRDSADEVTRVFTGEPGAADAMIPGVPVVQRRGSVIRDKAGLRFVPRLPWEPVAERERPFPELTGDEDTTPRGILPPPPGEPKK